MSENINKCRRKRKLDKHDDQQIRRQAIKAPKLKRRKLNGRRKSKSKKIHQKHVKKTKDFMRDVSKEYLKKRVLSKHDADKFCNKAILALDKKKCNAMRKLKKDYISLKAQLVDTYEAKISTLRQLATYAACTTCNKKCNVSNMLRCPSKCESEELYCCEECITVCELCWKGRCSSCFCDKQVCRYCQEDIKEGCIVSYEKYNEPQWNPEEFQYEYAKYMASTKHSLPRY